MIGHDLIKRVGGIEKAKAIVDGAPNGALTYNTTVRGYSEGWIKTFGNVVINDLRTAIAKHDEDHCNHEWNDMTSNGDKYRSLVCKNCGSTKNYLPLDEDHITDIRNHISPRTVVWDLASGEDWSVNHG